jgi:RNA polymerase sigma-70 factor (ECF subfamily)
MDEDRLVAALRQRDAEGAQELVRCCGDRLLRSAFLLCGNPTEAQDLVQETFVQAWKSAHRFRGGSSVYTWLHGILLNLSRHYHRDRQRLVCDDALAERNLPAPEEPVSGSDADAASASLAAALGRLSGPHREVVVLRFYEDLKTHEIAGRLGISPGTVKSRLHYAIAELQKMLPREMNLFGAGGTNKRETT